MRHVLLTCRNHPDLRWSCKAIAYTPGHGYNGSRNIFFQSRDLSQECSCPARDLVLAPDDTWASLSESEQAEAIRRDVAPSDPQPVEFRSCL